ncbi:MAG: diacylglycerol kinase [bacterium]|nr:diacylglycerol kinase [bacterium]
MGNSEARGIRRLINATRYSISGLKAAWKNEEAFRMEVTAALIMLPCAFWLGNTATQRGLLVGTCFVVMITELLNSAIETVVDRIGPDRHELSGRAKDIASAAVMLSLIMTLIIWALVIVERFCPA